VIDHLERFGVQLIEAVTSAARFHHQLRFPELTQVLGDRWPGDGESLGNPARRLCSLPKQVKHGAAGGIG